MTSFFRLRHYANMLHAQIEHMQTIANCHKLERPVYQAALDTVRLLKKEIGNQEEPPARTTKSWQQKRLGQMQHAGRPPQRQNVIPDA